jgi:glycosyltransferase involved in cell wall biosynthesis
MDPNTVVSIIVPLHQDSPLLDVIIPEIDRVISSSYRFFEIVLVDDGSTDGTAVSIQPILKKVKRIRYLRLSRPFGRDVALSAGIESAIGDYVVTIDPRTDPIDIIPKMIDACRKTGGIVHGIANNQAGRSKLREGMGYVFRNYCKKHMGVEIKRGVSDLRVMSRQAANALLQIREQSRYLRVLTLTLGYEHSFFPYSLENRPGSERQTGILSELATAIDLLAANTRHPLRVVTALGLFGAILNLLYGGYVLAIFLTKPGIAAGWTTLSLQLSGMFFFVCLILAVLSEYVGTILGEVRSRPLYFISQESNSTVLLEDTVQSSIVKESLGDL